MHLRWIRHKIAVVVQTCTEKGDRLDRLPVPFYFCPFFPFRGDRLRDFTMQRGSLLLLTSSVALSVAAPLAFAQETRTRGFAKADETRPKAFPHRIWAACDFEAQTP